MKSFIVLALVAAVAIAAPAENASPSPYWNPADARNAVILGQQLDNIGVEGYSYSYQTSDGQSVSVTATVKNLGTENEAVEVRGQYSYVSTDGLLYTTDYVANENGFQPSPLRVSRLNGTPL